MARDSRVISRRGFGDLVRNTGENSRLQILEECVKGWETGWGYCSMSECLPSMPRVLSPNPSAGKKKRKKENMF